MTKEGSQVELFIRFRSHQNLFLPSRILPPAVLADLMACVTTTPNGHHRSPANQNTKTYSHTMESTHSHFLRNHFPPTIPTPTNRKQYSILPPASLQAGIHQDSFSSGALAGILQDSSSFGAVRSRRRQQPPRLWLSKAECGKQGGGVTEMEEEICELGIMGRVKDRCKEAVGIADLLECLENEAIMGEDEGREPNDYNRRAHIFDKSSRVFQALKETTTQEEQQEED